MFEHATKTTVNDLLPAMRRWLSIVTERVRHGTQAARRHANRQSVQRTLRVFRRIRAGHVSIAIVLAVLVAAYYTLPLGAGPDTAPASWRIPSGGPVMARDTILPVFCLPETGPALRCGIAETHDRGEIGFTPYSDPPNDRTTLPVLATADIGLLWALADPAGRTEVQTSAAQLAGQMVSSIHQVTDSDAWKRDYRDTLRDVLDRAAQQAWRADDTQQAFRALMRASEPVLQDSIARQIGPAMAPYIAEAFWRVVKSNTMQVFSLITGSPLDLSSIGSTLSAAMQDPQVQAALVGVAPRIINLPQSELLTERFAANMADALQRDAATNALLTRVAMDPRLGNELGHVRNNVAGFMHQIGQVLWGLGGSSAMNSLAGLSMKTQIIGQSQPLILLLDTDDAAMLARTLPGRATLLVPASRR